MCEICLAAWSLAASLWLASKLAALVVQCAARWALLWCPATVPCPCISGLQGPQGDPRYVACRPRPKCTQTCCPCGISGWSPAPPHFGATGVCDWSPGPDVGASGIYSRLPALPQSFQIVALIVCPHRMVLKEDPKHVPGLALKPVGGRPHLNHAGHRGHLIHRHLGVRFPAQFGRCLNVRMNVG